ncbi:hypothetical protein CLV51_11190 [Chitinophaga niastensis]|uniref:Uncharacterized protein n=1 Tax=Chitinophaga niastensis TaxID=536980 RepID=A0A2P8H922_CHINA|nr:hypothetical protein CLV51_11190 [Chitinophaga niastensis]
MEKLQMLGRNLNRNELNKVYAGNNNSFSCSPFMCDQRCYDRNYDFGLCINDLCVCQFSS